MTTYYFKDVICAVCGTESEQREMGSTYVHQSPDLDLRPGEMRRSTMHTWLQTCPSCGFVAAALDAKIRPSVVKLVRSPAFQDWQAATVPAQALPFVVRAELLVALKRYAEAAEQWLHAAWSCDDGPEKHHELSGVPYADLAQSFRLRATQNWLEAMQRNPKLASADFRLRLTDVQRRAGLYAEASTMLDTVSPQDLQSFIDLERRLIDARDSAAYSFQGERRGPEA